MECITPSTRAILLIQFHNILGEQIIISLNSHCYTNLNPALTILDVNVLPVSHLGACLTDLAEKIDLISSVPGENLYTFYHWGDTVQIFIRCANFAHNFMLNQQAAVIVCEQYGMDYTLVITSLVHVISRPFCRTLSGRKFVYLNITKTHNESGSGPTFLLFLNCIYELLMMNMTCFEFTDKFLKNIYHHSFSSDYGNFLFDSPKDREEKKGCEFTLSLFSRLQVPENIKEYLNPIFNIDSLMKTEIPSQNYNRNHGMTCSCNQQVGIFMTPGRCSEI
ncbi:hypothetical protein MXB_189 [Myxobolus squamalis]|nr:hypothetical protein MXB_189 [Myxobolus squamalis]